MTARFKLGWVYLAGLPCTRHEAAPGLLTSFGRDECSLRVPRKTGMSHILDRPASLFLALGTLVVCAAGPAWAQGLIDGGFESYSVSSGGFVQPASGPWLFANDAGVVEPYAPNSSGGVLNTWSATFAPVEGQQYTSTYATLDSLRQAVTFTAAGQYRISVFAAAPSGSLTIPSVGTFVLDDGEFTFLLNNAAIGSVQTVPAGSGWSLFSADFTVAAPGDFQVGVRNTKVGSYFVNYDAFALEPIPEPTVLRLFLMLGVGVMVGRVSRWR
jgi:hypothetical protein